jgi:hypothetical protein
MFCQEGYFVKLLNESHSSSGLASSEYWFAFTDSIRLILLVKTPYPLGSLARSPPRHFPILLIQYAAIAVGVPEHTGNGDE